jgi:hypothetical protein
MKPSISSAASFTLVALLAPQAFAAGNTTFRCVVNGQTVFQQSPCAESGETVKQGLERKRLESEKAAEAARRNAEAVKARQAQLDARPMSSLTAVQQAERRAREADRQLTEAQARINDGSATREFEAGLAKYCGGKAYDQPVIGMSEEQMLHCTGMYRKPASVHTTTTAQGVSKQYVFNPYGGSSPTHYAYFVNGRLTAFQD